MTGKLSRVISLSAILSLTAALASAQTTPDATPPASDNKPKTEAAAPEPAAETAETAPAQPTPPPASPAPTPAPPEPAPPESASPEPADTHEPPPVSAEDIMKEFQQERPVAEPLLPRGQEGETIVRETESDPLAIGGAGARLPDGYILVDRTGRLHRDGEWWVLTFVADNHPETSPQPPMKLLPNRMLERMVRESQGASESIEFIVSGEVTDFLGENFLLLRKLMRKRELGNLSQ